MIVFYLGHIFHYLIQYILRQQVSNYHTLKTKMKVKINIMCKIDDENKIQKQCSLLKKLVFILCFYSDSGPLMRGEAATDNSK